MVRCSANFSPDGTRLVTACGLERTRLRSVWDVATGKPIGEPLRHEREVLSASFSPDGTRVVTASFDNTARIWDATTSKPIGEPLRHAAIVFSASFSPDGSRVVTASWDNTARVWDAPSRQTSSPSAAVLTWSNALAGLRYRPDGEIEEISLGAAEK